MKYYLIGAAATFILFSVFVFIGWCFAWYADSYAAFKGAIGL